MGLCLMTLRIKEELMYGIFMESLVILKLYTGLKLLLALSLLLWIFLLATEKNGKIRIVLVYAPFLVLALFLFPVSRKAFVAAGLDGETYYRVLWTIPMGVIFCYGVCRLSVRHRAIGLGIAGALVVVCGSCVYQSPYITRAENLYHIPGTVVKICDRIKSGDPAVRVSAVMPTELIHFVRQYDASINMPYGREMLVERWEYYNAVYEAIEKPQVVDMEELLAVTRQERCEYLVMGQEKQTDVDPQESGLLLIDEIDGYRIYQDPEVTDPAEETKE